MSVMISAIGVSYLLQNTATYVTGGQPHDLPHHPLPVRHHHRGGAPPPSGLRCSPPILVVALVILLTLLINRTKIGMAMRAVAKDFETSQLMGIKINSGHLHHLYHRLRPGGGGLHALLHHLPPPWSPPPGAMPGLKAFVAAVFGGIGSIPGAVIGAFLIGICENFIKAWTLRGGHHLRGRLSPLPC